MPILNVKGVLIVLLLLFSYRSLYGEPNSPCQGERVSPMDTPCSQPYLPLPRKFDPSENCLSSRCLTSVITRELVFPLAWVLELHNHRCKLCWLNFFAEIYMEKKGSTNICNRLAAWVGTIRRESTREENAEFFSR